MRTAYLYTIKCLIAQRYLCRNGQRKYGVRSCKLALLLWRLLLLSPADRLTDHVEWTPKYAGIAFSVWVPDTYAATMAIRLSPYASPSACSAWGTGCRCTWDLVEALGSWQPRLHAGHKILPTQVKPVQKPVPDAGMPLPVVHKLCIPDTRFFS
jgi:hypothetical protein